MPKGVSPEGTRAQEGLSFCNQLYELERQWREENPEARQKLRMEYSESVLEAFRKWLRIQRSQVLPKSKLGQAMEYCRN
ncbi:hypothetical protein PPOP_0124 [Paenibacillus popilliae ATCC 14706]|uniref:Transposase IS66 central domain-containing protein n=1 Tax=Paenibacillus popilliae ATCC 14706 TaxID=1212764 RepID=M9L7B3_PAEPP|nr:hypothetical protein PPOP_0124 [Paenibacillus popilliae ATCC 14706]